LLFFHEMINQNGDTVATRGERAAPMRRRPKANSLVPGNADQSMFRESMPSGFDPTGGNWFSEKDTRPTRRSRHFPIPPNREMS
jgi:hypothetical protein